eukprot:6185001-Pyramimonas_sp.AAC.1
MDQILAFATMIREGYILGIVAAPPCETWSGARHVALDGDYQGPPPLRSATHPWGMPHIDMRYRQQVQLGNLPMRAALLLAAVCIVTVTPMLMEHPARNWRPGTATCWALAQVRRMLAFQDVELITFDQCCFGA